jgi:hypothetical protein
MTCLFKRHQFRVVGRQAIGMCLEKVIECKRCQIIVIINNLHPKYRYVYDNGNKENWPETVYLKAKRLNRLKPKDYILNGD